MAETTQRNVRVDDELWQQVQDKVFRLRRAHISASSVCVKALEDFVAEPDGVTFARFGPESDPQ